MPTGHTNIGGCEMADMFGQSEYICTYVNSEGIGNFGLFQATTEDSAREMARKEFNTTGRIEVSEIDKLYHGWTFYQ